MDAELRKVQSKLVLGIRQLLEGYYDDGSVWHAGDLEQQLNQIGVWKDRSAKPLDELPQLSEADNKARRTVEAYVKYREETGVNREEAVEEYIQESAYNWFNRLFALRCMEARGIIDEIILQKDIYGGRSLLHNRLAIHHPELCGGEDDGLYALLFEEFKQRTHELPMLFNPESPAVALRPSVSVIKKLISILSGIESVNGDYASNEVFTAPDAFGWAYQYWNAEKKERVFDRVRIEKAKIEGKDIIPATCIYTEQYMVKFLVQNSLGALWGCMHPESRLSERWDYYARDADRSPLETLPVKEITFLDPACGSGHFLQEAFDLYYDMYLEEGELKTPTYICTSILENNLYGIDIDERAVQISLTVLWMKAKERAPRLDASELSGFYDHLVASNINLPKGKEHHKKFLKKYRADAPLQPALELIFKGLENADELGSLLKIEEPIKKVFAGLMTDHGVQTTLWSNGVSDIGSWKQNVIIQLKENIYEEAASTNLSDAFFNQSMNKGLRLIDLLSNKYNVVATNPPYMGRDNYSEVMREYLNFNYENYSADLYSSFIYLCNTLVKRKNGFIAFVSPQSWYTLVSFKDLRIDILPFLRPYLIIGLGQRVFKEAPLLYVALTVLKIKSEYALTKNLNEIRDKKGSLLGSIIGSSFEKLEWAETNRLSSKQLFFNLPKKLRISISQGPFLSTIADSKIGIQTGDNKRYIRFLWELPHTGLLKASRWHRLIKSSGFKRWWLPFSEYIDWESNGFRIKENPKSYPRNEVYYYRKGIGCSKVSGGRLSGHLWDGAIIIGGTVLVVPKKDEFISLIHLVLNSTIANELLVGLSPTLNFNPGYFDKLPIPSNITHNKEIDRLSDNLVTFTKMFYNYDEWYSPCIIPNENSLITALNSVYNKLLTIKNELINLTRKADLLVSDLYGLEPSRLSSKNRNNSIERGLPELAKITLQSSGEPGPNWYYHLASNWISTICLMLLGHRWPRQIDEDTPVPDWVDPDGIIPLTGDTGEPILLERIRQRMYEGFESNSIKIESEFHELVGNPLEEWLIYYFFKNHISKFKKRPIAWQIQSTPPISGKRKGRSRDVKPAFSCLVYFQKLDGDTLPKVRSQYVGPLLNRYNAELRTLETYAKSDPDQDTRKLRLGMLIEELEDFDDRLENVITTGFTSKKIKDLIEDEPLDKWTSFDGESTYPSSRDEFYLQERSYFPDVNDGVRVNIAPLQKAGLLASDVLSSKDVDKAISDRAIWRADERRWCREGKQSKPGSWK